VLVALAMVHQSVSRSVIRSDSW